MRLPVDCTLPLAVLMLLAACGGNGEDLASMRPAPRTDTGPAGDYPVVIGQPYSAGGVVYTPSDTMNYDVVGRASLSAQGGPGITAAHHTLPLPSYVEVTELTTGKTILVRVERRGPLNSTNVIELSPGAAAQLGVNGRPQASVRVRRVNPTEPERAVLRNGEAAPPRMDTPKSLLAVLLRKLDAQEGVARPVPTPVQDDTPAPPSGGTPAGMIKPKPAALPAPPPRPAPRPAEPAVRGSLIVQVGSFSNETNARAAATRTGGRIYPNGRLWRVRMGPFANEAQASAALARARTAGYNDARIQSAY